MIVCLLRVHVWTLFFSKHCFCIGVQLLHSSCRSVATFCISGIFYSRSTLSKWKTMRCFASRVPFFCENWFQMWRRTVRQPESIVSHRQEVPSGSETGVDVPGSATRCVWYLWLRSAQCQVGPGTLGCQREEPNRNISKCRSEAKGSIPRLFALAVEWSAMFAASGMSHCQTGSGRLAGICCLPPPSHDPWVRSPHDKVLGYCVLWCLYVD